MSSIASSAAANPTGTSCGTNGYQIPSSDVACAVASTTGLPDNYTDMARGCCKDAPVESYAGDCAFYCLSVGQSVADLFTCFQDEGISPGLIFCNSNNTATATGKPSGGGSATGTGSQSSGTAESGARESTGAAAAAVCVPQTFVSKAGLGMLAMMVVSAVAGTVL